MPIVQLHYATTAIMTHLLLRWANRTTMRSTAARFKQHYNFGACFLDLRSDEEGPREEQGIVRSLAADP